MKEQTTDKKISKQTHTQTQRQTPKAERCAFAENHRRRRRQKFHSKFFFRIAPIR